MIYCPRCQTENRRDAHFCYQCSYNFQKKNKKRPGRSFIILILIVGLVWLFFRSCGPKLNWSSNRAGSEFNSSNEQRIPRGAPPAEMGSPSVKPSDGSLVTASGLKLVQSPPPPMGKPQLQTQIPAPSSGLKTLQKLPSSQSGLTFIEEMPGGKGLEFIQQGANSGLKVVQEVSASSGVQMIPLPSGSNIIVLQMPANSQGIKVIQLPSFSSASSPSASSANPDDVVKETPSPEPVDKEANKPMPAETPDQKKDKDTDLSQMALIPAGDFMMGSPSGKGNSDEHPQHKVWVSAFYMDKYLVTFDQYDKFCEATGRDPAQDNGWGRGKNPVINIKWGDADAYCRWAGKRLPTEAEWEKAARGGTDTSYFFGEDPGQLKDYAWYADNSNDRVQPVGQKKPNPYGLYDIVGNVWEWVNDYYGQSYYDESPAQNPPGPAGGEYRVLRGGSWNINADYLESAHRGMDEPDHQDTSDGCRCAKSR